MERARARQDSPLLGLLRFLDHANPSLSKGKRSFASQQTGSQTERSQLTKDTPVEEAYLIVSKRQTQRHCSCLAVRLARSLRCFLMESAGPVTRSRARLQTSTRKGWKSTYANTCKQRELQLLHDGARDQQCAELVWLRSNCSHRNEDQARSPVHHTWRPCHVSKADPTEQRTEPVGQPR